MVRGQLLLLTLASIDPTSASIYTVFRASKVLYSFSLSFSLRRMRLLSSFQSAIPPAETGG